MPDEQLIKAQWVCAGERLGSDEKLAQLWYPLRDDGTIDTSEGWLYSLGKKGSIAHTIVGGVFDVTYIVKDDGHTSVKLGDLRPKYSHTLEDEKQVSLWRIEQEKNRADAKLYRKERAALGDKEIALLAPISELYLNTRDSVGRTLILGAVIRYITTGVPLSRTKKES